MRYLLTPILILLLCGPTLAAGTSLTSDPLLEPYLVEGLQKSPRLATARFQGAQAAAGIAAAGALPDPKLGLVFNNYPVDSFAGDETPMTGKIIKLSQAFPYPGKLAAKEGVAEARSASMQARVEEEALMLRRDLVKAWNDLLLKRELVRVAEEKLQALSDFQGFIEARYAVGKSGQQDVIGVQVSRTEAMNGLSMAKQQAKGALFEFNRLLDRTAEQEPETTGALAAYPLPSLDAVAPEAIEANRPLFQLYRARIDENRQRVKLADLQGSPDFSIGAGYTYRESSPMYDSTDFLTVEFGMTLPFVNRSRVNSERAQADAGLQAARSDYHTLLTDEQMKIFDLQTMLQQQQERVALYTEGVVPQSKQGYEASLSAYTVGRTEFSMLLKSLLTVYMAEAEQLRAVADFNKTVAEYRYRTGADSTALRTLLTQTSNPS